MTDTCTHAGREQIILKGAVADKNKGHKISLWGRRKLASLIKYGIRAIGLADIEKLLAGQKIGRTASIRAKCYDCMGGYADGVRDCEDSGCPLYEYHSYKSN